MVQLYHAAFAAALATSVTAKLYPNTSPVNHSCVLEPSVISCSSGANPKLVDTCCTETFGGLVLVTQFWSTWTGLESKGQLLPPNTWTVHGLWPDFCNGSYTQYCDLSRQYDPVPSPNTTNGLANGTVVPAYKGPTVATFLEKFGRFDLINWMNTYWINQQAPNTDLWAHEFSKHATCFSTFDVPCYGPQYVENEDVVDFFDTTIKYYKKFPTWEWLNEAHILPSNKTTYTLSDVQAALTKKSGAIPYIGCSGPRYNTTQAGAGGNDTGRTVISEVWYYGHVVGRPQDGNFLPVNATSSSGCAKAKGALHYYEVTPGSLRSK